MATLLVGEGNFSFSLCLARRGREENIVSTSYETEEQIAERPTAQENVRELRKLGVHVLHGVNGTKLHTYPQLQELSAEYTTVIFNFPHTGGKSNIKRNRQLLRDFFTSAAKILSPRGRVCVTLCKGQGGTPADSDQRGHHNSWRVVEMAAEAGLLLTDVQQFDPIAHVGYEPSGYRGGGRGFALQGALEHVFTLPQPDPASWEVVDDRVCDICRFCCGTNQDAGIEVGRQMRERGLVLRSLLVFPWHPVTRVHRLLVGALQLQAGQGVWSRVESEVLRGSGVHRAPSACCPGVSEGDVCWQASGRNEGDTTLAGNGTTNQEDLFILQSSPSQLLPSLLNSIRSTTGRAGLHTVTSPLVRETVIFPNPSLQPISHCLCGVLSLPSSSQSRSHFLSLRHSVVLALKSLISDPTLTLMSGPATLQSIWTPSAGDVNIILAGGENATLATFQSHTHRKWEEFPAHFLTFSVNLDTLAMAVCGISHVSLLWCSDRRFTEQFNRKHDAEKVVFKPFSLFAPCYTHDISFWVPPDAGRGGREKIEVWRAVRTVAGRKAVRVAHLETYREERREGRGEEGGEERVSMCYRVEYSSPGEALSWTQTRELQLRVRERLVSQVPGLELR